VEVREHYSLKYRSAATANTNPLQALINGLKYYFCPIWVYSVRIDCLHEYIAKMDTAATTALHRNEFKTTVNQTTSVQALN